MEEDEELESLLSQCVDEESEILALLRHRSGFFALLVAHPDGAEDAVVVRVESDWKGLVLVLKTEVGRRPHEGQAEFFAFLLANNFVSQNSGGAYFSLSDPDEGGVYLADQIPLAGGSPEVLSKHIISFSHRALSWRILISDPQAPLCRLGTVSANDSVDGQLPV